MRLVSHTAASMEPRPHERGKCPPPRNRESANSSFNGATSSRTWKADIPRIALENPICFNGATSSRTWKGRVNPLVRAVWVNASMEPRPHERGKTDQSGCRCYLSQLLQWSHVLTNVERGSMYGYPGDVNNSFNGATSSRTWKENRESAEPAPIARFNGATSSRTWKATVTAESVEAQALLQWSHVLTNVERSHCRPPLRPPYPASMEPRPHERGKSYRECHLPAGVGASMEPRPHERGKVDIKSCTVESVPASMEPRPHERGKLHELADVAGLIGASMEPRPHERGKRFPANRTTR